MTFTIRITSLNSRNERRESVHAGQVVKDDAPIVQPFMRHPSLRAVTQDFGSHVITYEREFTQ